MSIFGWAVGPAEGVVLFAVSGVMFVIWLILTILYLLTMQTALSRCSAESRTLSPGLVWLQLVPLFNLVWMFIVVLNVSKSLGNEFRGRGVVESPRPGQGVGLAMATCGVLSIIPLLGIPLGMASFACGAMYWMKVTDCSSRIAVPVTA